jgi:hypothetical protein
MSEAPFNPQPGDRVLYRCPKGFGSGRVIHAAEGKYMIETSRGKRVVRTSANVRPMPAGVEDIKPAA